MKKRVFAILLTVAMLLSLMPTAVFAADIVEEEVNDSFAVAQSIPVNEAVTGDLASSSDVDYYTFTLSQPGSISLTFNHEYINSSSSYWYVTLYDGDREELTSHAFVGNEPENTCNPIGLPAGTYYAKVDHIYYFYHTDSPYALTINYTASDAWEREFNDSFAVASSVSTNMVVNGNLMNSNDVDYYEFTLSAPGYISLTFNHEYINSNSSYWAVTLYSGDHAELTSYSFAGNEPENTCNPIGLPAGTYYAKVDHIYYFHHTDSPYALTINYTESNAWETEFNDSFAVANTISPNRAVSGSIMRSGDVDYYKFTLSAEDQITLAFNHDYINSGSSYWNIALYDVNQNQLNSYSIAGNSKNSVTTPKDYPAGTYYARVSAGMLYNSSMKYTLTVISQNNNKFTDVPVGAYYVPAVVWAVEEGITSGTSDTTFSPNASCTRGQIVTFLWNAAGKPEPATTENPFTDVPDGQYYTKAVLWAVENGITSGTSATTFSPGKTCTRAEAVTFQYRAAGEPAVSAASSFADVPAGAYYANAVAWAVAEGITSGTGGNNFSPNSTCTRAQIVSFLYRELG